MAQKPEFEFFGWGDKDPTNKYIQPKPNTHKPGNQEDTGYPQTDVKTSGIEMRGYGAATKGKMCRGPMA
jgi:hypothetical protein